LFKPLKPANPDDAPGLNLSRGREIWLNSELIQFGKNDIVLFFRQPIGGSLEKR